MSSVVTQVDSEAEVEVIPELNVPNAAVSLIFLDASEILYANKTGDPWFSASTPFDNSLLTSSPTNRRSYFVPDEPVGVLGCVTQRSYCNPNIPKDVGCINGFAVVGGQNSSELLKRAWSDVNDQSAMRAFVAALSNAGAGFLDTFYALPNLPTLISRSTILGNMQTAIIPKDRWQDEREHLYKASLAAIQSIMVEHARGLTFGKNAHCDDEMECSRICHSQVRVLSTSLLTLTSAATENPLFQALFFQFLEIRYNPGYRKCTDTHINIH